MLAILAIVSRLCNLNSLQAFGAAPPLSHYFALFDPCGLKVSPLYVVNFLLTFLSLHSPNVFLVVVSQVVSIVILSSECTARLAGSVVTMEGFFLFHLAMDVAVMAFQISGSLKNFCVAAREETWEFVLFGIPVVTVSTSYCSKKKKKEVGYLRWRIQEDLFGILVCAVVTLAEFEIWLLAPWDLELVICQERPIRSPSKARWSFAQ